ncbi:hypothetical protein XENOCAPTIV_008627 [Xenoophorus captivus]|uniref:NPC1 middle luminal domain-containing protein n=1 Tax=Xenoophorus captivus TaxID=1517983 RepID=A0ABV0RQZ9_9TELE
MTFSLNNYIRNDPKFKVALQWEAEFLKIVQDYQSDPAANFTFAYMAEKCCSSFCLLGHRVLCHVLNRLTTGNSSCPVGLSLSLCLQRSLEDEINRTTAEDIPIFMISYAVIFVYIAVALGEYSSCKRLLVRLRRVKCNFNTIEYFSITHHS